MRIHEVKQDTLGRPVQFWKHYDFPPCETKLKLAEPDFLPASRERVVNADPDFCRSSSRMVARAFKADALKVQVLAKLNHDP